MKRRTIKLLVILGVLLPGILNAQGERKYIRQGNREYFDSAFDQSELKYRKALEKDLSSYEGNFNLGDALYKEDKFDDASRRFIDLAGKETDPKDLSKICYNLGNSLLQSGKVGESIEAYKNALRNNPDDIDAKHNLAWAMRLLQQQQQQQQQQNQNQDQNNKDQQNQQKQDQDKQEQQQNQQKDKISQEDANRLLEALQQDEKQLQEKLKKQMARTQRVAVLKEW